MKHKVIGWTYYDDTEILDSNSTVSIAETNTIIDEIKRHKYLFSGWHHQESYNGVVPILNDGRKRCFSQRVWGYIMAEAYGYTGEYDYSLFAFNHFIDDDKLKFAPCDFDIDCYKPKIIKNEHFKINVTKEIFEIAKVSNPFYLEDLKELRYIDENDTITLNYNNEKLTFIVKDIHKDKANAGLKKSKHIIKGKNQLIVYHKPKSEKQIAKIPLIITGNNYLDLFKNAMLEYNYDMIKELVTIFNIEELTKDLNKDETIESLTRFVNEYSTDLFEKPIMLQVLKYLDDYDLFEKIADKNMNNDPSLYIEFINFYLEKNKNMDDSILKFAYYISPNESLDRNGLNIIIKALSIENSKLLCKKFYKLAKNRNIGLAIMAGANLFKYLKVEDKKYIELNNYENYSFMTILKIIEYLTYPVKNLNKDNYPYYLPEIYKVESKVIDNGVLAYQNYVKKTFDIETIFLKMIKCGIDKCCLEMNRFSNGREDAAKYVYSLDLLTNFKYDLKEYAKEKYIIVSNEFQEELESIYNIFIKK